MSVLKNTDILSLMESRATLHPLIGHDAADRRKIRFYGFNPGELMTAGKSRLNYDTLIMGLSIPKQTPVGWSYFDTGTSTLKKKYFEVAVLGKFKLGDYTTENIICERAETVLDHFEMWLDDKSASEARCDFPIIEYIDRASISCRRVNNIGVGLLSGAVMRVPLQDWVVYDSVTNPFTD